LKPAVRAVIDVGTNSIKVLVAEISGQEVRPLLEDSKQTRLGKGFYESHTLQPGAIAMTAKAVAKFAEIARAQNASSTRVIATSAVRDAVNASVLVDEIKNAAGLTVEIISGEQEADWVFKGVASDPALAHEPLLLLDVGGGSTEFILGQGQTQHFRRSFPIGTVRLMEMVPPGDPPKPSELIACRQWLANFLRAEVAPSLEPVLRRESSQCRQETAAPGVPRQVNAGVQLVGTGGTTSILARMENHMEDFDRARIEGTRLSLERLRWHVSHLWGMPLEARKKIVGLPPNRADVILTGAAVYEAILEGFGFSELRVSTRGLRFAAVMDR
jgi:exopolyphosphatase/guanosine-5'-triphosphate,3'-diphosphate pyrophosphatase